MKKSLLGQSQSKGALRHFAVLIVALCVFSISEGVTLRVDQVRQRYPWNGLIDVDYTISYTNDESIVDPLLDRLEFAAIDKSVSPAVTNAMWCINPAPVDFSAGRHRVTWDANADGVFCQSEDLSVSVVLRRYPVKYLIVDITAGADAESYPCSYVESVPLASLNTVANKSNRIVFRMIPPGSFMMGSPADEPGRSEGKASGLGYKKEMLHSVALTKPYYIGIFELTQAQYERVMGTIPTQEFLGESRPVGNIDYATLRGGSDNICKRLSDRTGLNFAMPTEAQWESACRAGTTTPYNTGTVITKKADLLSEMRKVGISSQNVADGDYGAGTSSVGRFQPNAYGLYDMHGNVEEWCEDLVVDDLVAIGQRVDPTGPTSSSDGRMRRGGSFYQEPENCRSASRRDPWPEQGYSFRGCRLVVNPFN